MPKQSAKRNNKVASSKLSLIVPVFHCATIAEDLQRIHTTVQKIAQHYELICVVDGIYDQFDQTAKKVEALNLPHLHIISYTKNHGKGYAIRTGFQHACGDVIGFIDAGNDIDPAALQMAYRHILRSSDVVIGSKRHLQSKVNYPLIRRIYSFMLQWLISVFFALYIKDTQVGLKLFRGQHIKHILPKLKTNRWALDLEILALLRRHYPQISILEIPVTITYNFSTNVRWSAAIDFFFQFFKMYIEMNILKKYD